MGMRSLVPPRERGLPLVGNLLAYWRDPLEFMRAMTRRHGDVVVLPMANTDVWLFSHPDQIEQVLVSDARSFIKDRTTHELSRVAGNGLLTSEGDFWRRQRRLMQPAFHRDRIAGYAGSMVAATGRMLHGWRAGERRDLHAEMMRLTLDIVAKTLFDSDLAADAQVIGDSIATLSNRFMEVLPLLVPVLNELPTPGARRMRRAIAALDEVITRMIREHRRVPGEGRGDLLDMLLSARDEDGSRMSDQQVRDEVTTLLLAGHETTAIALTWAFHLLCAHPAVDEKVAEEVRALGDRPLALADLPRLRFCEQVVMESLRLYPPAWAIGREATCDIEVGGWRVPRGAQIWLSPWLVQRDARWFDEPLAFRPERWAGDLQKKLPRHAYFPFGGGPRVCIGNSFAMMEATLLLAGILQKWRFVAERAPRPQPAVTLRPGGGLPVRLIAR
jgi:cytochrome P450